MEARCRFKNWGHSKIQEMSNTSLMLDGSPKSLERLNTFRNRRNVKNTSIMCVEVRCRFNGVDAFEIKEVNYIFHLSFWMEVRSRFKGWMHSKIKEMSNTYFIFDGSPMSLQQLGAFENQINFKYISHFGWKSEVA